MYKDKQLKECWDNLVLEYDPKNSLKKFWCKPEAWVDEIAKRLYDCEKILDVGSGSGALSIPLSKKIRYFLSGFLLKYAFTIKE